MKFSTVAKRSGGMTMVEVLMVLAVIIVLGALFFPALSRPRQSRRVRCLNNLKLVGLAFRLWEGDNGDYYPMFTPKTNGGTMEFSAGPNAWRHFQVMSNEIDTPNVLICPSETDRNRQPAANIDSLSNSNLSFFVGMVSNELDPQMILSGDRNLTNGSPVKNGLLELAASRPSGWTADLHNNCGNLTAADGHVEQIAAANLSAFVAGTGTATNVLQMPVLGP